MYQSDTIILKDKNKELLNYCNEYSQKSKLFKNSIYFVIRQLYFMKLKNFVLEDFNDHQKEVYENFKITYNIHKYDKNGNINIILNILIMIIIFLVKII